MYEIADKLVQDVEQGRLSRRAAVTQLVAVASVMFAGGSTTQSFGSETKPLFQSKGLNHIALNVPDLQKSINFYQKTLGLSVLQQGDSNAFLAAGGNNFVGLFKSDQARMNHYAYTIDNYDASRVVEKLEGAGLAPERHQDRVYFDDPDGLQLQLTGEWEDYPGPR